MVRFFLGVGRIHKVAPKDIVGAIAGETGIPGKAIGAIRILDSYSFVEVPKEHASDVYTIMKERTIRNQPTGIEPASGSNRRDVKINNSFFNWVFPVRALWSPGIPHLLPGI